MLRRIFLCLSYGRYLGCSQRTPFRRTIASQGRKSIDQFITLRRALADAGLLRMPGSEAQRRAFCRALNFARGSRLIFVQRCAVVHSERAPESWSADREHMLMMEMQMQKDTDQIAPISRSAGSDRVHGDTGPANSTRQGTPILWLGPMRVSRLQPRSSPCAFAVRVAWRVVARRSSSISNTHSEMSGRHLAAFPGILTRAAYLLSSRWMMVRLSNK
jgi:hypothetical protein